MRKGRLSLLCAALMAATAMSLVEPAVAQSSKVGITSATDGDPLGKPPSGAERVLKIGVDVQANEIVTTKANDRAHLMFLDGSSLTVGPNAQLTIDKFVYDPNTKTGELAITATQGVFRLVGGKISKNNPVTINTPSSTIGIRGGIGMFGVNSKGTTAAFLFGHNMTVSGQGQTQNVTRPGSQVIVNLGAPPGPPSLLPPGALAGLVNSLENSSSSSSSSSSSGGGGSGSGGGNSGSGGSGADSKAASSGLSGTNSGSSQSAPPGIGPGPTGGGGGPPTQTNNAVANAINSTGTANPQNNVVQTSTPAPPPSGQTTGTDVGYVGGLVVRTPPGSGSSSTTNTLNSAASLPGDLTINRNSTTATVAATVLIRGFDGTVTSPNAQITLGNQANSSFFQNDVTFLTGTDTDQGSFKSTTSGQVIGHFTNSSLVVTVAEVPIAVQTHKMTNPDPYITNGLCSACTFLTFGYWQSLITESNGTTSSITQAPWVTGQLAVQLPMTGRATYQGVMLGQAQDANGFRNVAGTYTNDWCFQCRQGQFSGYFDSRQYTGTLQLNNQNSVSFSGNIATPPGTPAFTGNVSGSFNISPGQANGSVPAGQTGQFHITGPAITPGGAPSYVAGGIIAGAVTSVRP